MTPERWQQVKRIVADSAERSAEELPVWLDEACGGDQELKHEVESLLAYEDDLEDFSADSPGRQMLAGAFGGTTLDGGAPGGIAVDGVTAPDGEDAIGRRIGPYRLRGLLGRGGMGAVYLAEREEGFEQQVALKLTHAGFDSRETIRRFHRERQILARLEHPTIARLLDGGTGDDGRPYFAMELVDGEPIDRYCDRHRLPVRQRLELLLPICEALEFAHRNLVVHRDLKPSNILVTADGAPKLLDFGIAKLLGTELEATRAATRAGSQPMTLHYASPEQLEGLPISTASDVYSLGVVLYRLLTGRLPLGLESLTLAQVARAVCEDEPRPPSEAVLAEETAGFGKRRRTLTPAAVAEERGADPASLKRRLSGDVDAIIAKALRKEPARRYASVEQLAADLRRHLDGLPVLARRGTLTYRAGKFVRRHRWGVATAAAVLALILAFAATLARQLERTELERDRAARVSDFMVGLFRAAEPDRAGGEPSVRDLVDAGRRRLETELAQDPEQRAALLGTLGQVYWRLGHYAAARESLEASLAALSEHGDHSGAARALNDLAAVAYERGEHQRAERLYRQSIAMRQRLGLDDQLLKPRNNLAAILVLRGELDEAAVIYRQSLAERRAALGARHPNVATSLRSLANALYFGGDFNAAEPLLLEALDIRREAFGPDAPAVATVLASLGRLAHARGELDAAGARYAEALDVRRRRLGDFHLHVAALEVDLAALLIELGEVDTAGVLLSRAIGVLYAAKPEDDWHRAAAESVYGAYLAARGRFAEAETCLAGAADTLERVRGDVVLTRHARRRLADLERMKGSVF